MNRSPCPPTGSHVEIDDGKDTEEGVVCGTTTINEDTYLIIEVTRPRPGHLDTIGGVELNEDDMDTVRRQVPPEFCTELPPEAVFS